MAILMRYSRQPGDCSFRIFRNAARHYLARRRCALGQQPMTSSNVNRIDAGGRRVLLEQEAYVAQRASQADHFRFWHKADIPTFLPDVCFRA
jgi:hypothetical protein